MLLRDIRLTEAQIDLNSKKSIDNLAHDLHEKGFPETFSVTVEVGSIKHSLVFELDEKKVNDHKGYHVLTFVYSLSSKSSKLVHDLLRKSEADDDFYDEVSEKLKIDTIEVHAEIGHGVEKVYGHAS